MSEKRRDIGNEQNLSELDSIEQNLSELDSIEDMDEGLLFPTEMSAEETAILDEIGTLLPAREQPKPSDLHGVKVPESIEGSSEQLLIRAGEELLWVLQGRKNRRAANDNDPGE